MKLMKMEMKLWLMKMTDARIENWVRVGDVICGEIYEDSKGRFVDGHLIVTSRIVSVKDDIAETVNTVYKLGVPYRYRG